MRKKSTKLEEKRADGASVGLKEEADPSAGLISWLSQLGSREVLTFSGQLPERLGKERDEALARLFDLAREKAGRLREIHSAAICRGELLISAEGSRVLLSLPSRKAAGREENFNDNQACESGCGGCE
jgi:hypothetical protein